MKRWALFLCIVCNVIAALAAIAVGIGLMTDEPYLWAIAMGVFAVAAGISIAVAVGDGAPPIRKHD